jgi:methylase of polypeptide subunit release factors
VGHAIEVGDAGTTVTAAKAEPSPTAWALRTVLNTIGYDEDSVRGLTAFEHLDPSWGAAGLRLRPNANERLPVLVRLFVAGERLTKELVAGVVAPVELGALAAAGLVECAGAGVRALVRLDPLHGIVVASDFRERDGSTAREHVVFPGPAAVALASLTIRAPVSRTLDLFCGSGVQALLAARHSETVIATDLNPRALRLAELSAALSGIDNVHWGQGDLFAPVADDSFDLIVANPPFVISPSRELMFRDGGHRSDGLSKAVLLGVAERLNEGAYGHVLCSWVHTTSENWIEPARRWLAGSACDIVALRFHTQTPATYAIAWTAADGGPPDEVADRAASWVEYYRSLDVAQITTAFVALRRRRGQNWVHTDEFVRADWNGGGSHLARVFEGYDALERVSDDRALLARPLRLASGAALIERRRPGTGLDRARLTNDSGLALPGRIDPPPLAAVLFALDGRRSLTEAAAAAGLAPGDLEAGLSCVRDLIRRGYLIVT